MTCGNCMRCQHWGKDEPEAERRWDAKAAELRACGAIKRGWVIADDSSKGIERDYDMPDQWDADKPDPADRYMAARAEALKQAKATVWDGSEYRAELLTTPDFGCVLFEERAHERQETPTTPAAGAP